MLIRRFLQHFKEQNWFAVGLDVIVVIVGIFLGLQFTDWNDARKDRLDETHFIQRLHDDLMLVEQASARVLERRLQNFEDLKAAIAVLRSTDPNKQLSLAECTAIGNSDILNVVVTDLPALVELQSSGRLGIIQSDELRRSAVSLQQRIISLKDIIEQMTFENIQLLMVFPELIQVTSVFNEELNEINLSTTCDLDGMRKNPGFINSLSTNLDIFDAYVRDGILPWQSELDRLMELTEAHLALKR